MGLLEGLGSAPVSLRQWRSMTCFSNGGAQVETALFHLTVRAERLGGGRGILYSPPPWPDGRSWVALSRSLVGIRRENLKGSGEPSHFLNSSGTQDSHQMVQAALTGRRADNVTTESSPEVKEGFGNQINLCRDGGLNPGRQYRILTPYPLDRQVTQYIVTNVIPPFRDSSILSVMCNLTVLPEIRGAGDTTSCREDVRIDRTGGNTMMLDETTFGPNRSQVEGRSHQERLGG
uniref:(California timema) hypothetical protein n=1 Tax=Timema californicum TaxID=61474 RepID=A0A7R9JJ61_TIMCA|nr:unnamed protein product [Timema californicum]